MTNEEISLKTKDSLARALKAAMEKKPLNRITVSELVKECDINRKTFYYHFRDIYDLFHWMLGHEAFGTMDEIDFIYDTEKAIRYVMDYMEENRRILISAYNSIGYDDVKRFFQHDFYAILDRVIEECEQLLGARVGKEFRKFVCEFYCEAIAGMAIEWLKGRFVQDREVIIQNMLLILKVSIPEIMKERIGRSSP